MTLDRKLIEEACLALWEKHHEAIEKIKNDSGVHYSLGKNSYMQGGPEGFQIIASISPNYSPEMLPRFRKIIGKEFEYKGEKIGIIISPSISEIFRTAPRI